MKNWIKKYSNPLIRWSTLAACLIFLISSWLFPESFVHLLLISFAVQGGVLLLLLGAYFTWKRQYILLFLSVATSAVMLNPVILEWKDSRQPEQMTPRNGDLRIAHFNVLRVNDNSTEIVEKALASGASILSIQENNRSWDRKLKGRLTEEYPYQLSFPSDDCYGISVYSKMPFLNHRVWRVEGKKCVIAAINWQGKKTHLALVHATSPGTPTAFEQRNRHLDHLAEKLRSVEPPLIVIGDLNAVPWDPVLLRWRDTLALNRSGGFAPTFPVPALPLMIPLDHVMHTSEIQPVDFKLIPVWSSDHFGICTSLRLQG